MAVNARFMGKNQITDDTRINASMPTIRHIINNGGRLGAPDRRGAGIDETATAEQPTTSHKESANV